MNKFKKLTHWFAGGLATAVAGAITFSQTTAGHAIIAQYPKAAGFVTLFVTVATIAGVYHQPKEVPPLGN